MKTFSPLRYKPYKRFYYQRSVSSHSPFHYYLNSLRKFKSFSKSLVFCDSAQFLNFSFLNSSLQPLFNSLENNNSFPFRTVLASPPLSPLQHAKKNFDFSCSPLSDFPDNHSTSLAHFNFSPSSDPSRSGEATIKAFTDKTIKTNHSYYNLFNNQNYPQHNIYSNNDEYLKRGFGYMNRNSHHERMNKMRKKFKSEANDAELKLIQSLEEAISRHKSDSFLRQSSQPHKYFSTFQGNHNKPSNYSLLVNNSNNNLDSFSEHITSNQSLGNEEIFTPKRDKNIKNLTDPNPHKTDKNTSSSTQVNKTFSFKFNNFKQNSLSNEKFRENITSVCTPLTEKNARFRAKSLSDLQQQRNLQVIIPKQRLSSSANVYFPQSNSCFNNSPSSFPHNHYTKFGFRLGRRKILTDRRRLVSNMCLFLAFFGIICMILETELTMAKVYSKSSSYSFYLKVSISASTILLIHFIIAYHHIQTQLYIVNNCLEDWKIALNWTTVLQAALEIVVCSIHPLPINLTLKWKSVPVVEEDPDVIGEVETSIDLLFTFPMFLRFYLVGRVMLLQSRILSDASAISIGALNRISFNVKFVLKTLMTICPGTALLVLMLTVWILSSWTLRVCESHNDPKHHNFLNSLWMIAITFLSVGYGDVVPHTYCGRIVAIFTGIMGSGCTALVVAVFARKIELTRAERHVHNFMIDNQLSKKLKHAAANVLRETWFIYKYTSLSSKLEPFRVRRHQSKFLRAITRLRDIRSKLRTLNDNANTMMDVTKHLTHSALNATPSAYSSQPPAVYLQVQEQLNELLSQLYSQQLSTEEQTEGVEQKIDLIKERLEGLTEEILKKIIDSPLWPSQSIEEN